MYGHHDAAGAVVESIAVHGISGISDGLPGYVGDVHIAIRGDLTHNYHQARRGAGLAGHPAHGVLGHNGIQHSVRDLVAELIGMSLGDGLRGEQVQG